MADQLRVDNQRLLRDNENLKIALAETKNKLDEKANSLKIQKEIFEHQKKRFDDNIDEYSRLEAKYWRTIQETEEVEKNAKDNFKKLKDTIDKKERELNEVQTKYLNFVDFDLEQKKIENKLELKYGREIEDKQRIIDDLNRKLNELIRDNEVAKARLESSKMDNEESLKVIKDAQRRQIDLLMSQIGEFQNQKVFTDYKDKYNEMKIKKEELENRNDLLNKEVQATKGELNFAKTKYNQTVADNVRDNEKLRNDLLQCRTQNEKILQSNS